jgi:hypothetical protein
MHSVPKPVRIVYSNSVHHNFTIAEKFEIYHEVQLRSMADSILRSLAGAASGFGIYSPMLMNDTV